MQKLFQKIAPLGLMTACAIWCCWSQIREATPLLAATEAKLPRIERELLHPELSPVSERDPFLQHKPEPPPVEEAVATQTLIPEQPPFDPQTILPSIRLDATMPGVRALAVINGKIHREGEFVVVEAMPEVKCRLQRVHADGIVMKIEEGTYFIGYSYATKEVEDPEAAPQPPGEIEHELPEGTPTPDELDAAVAESLANPLSPTNEEQFLISTEADDSSELVAPEEEACEFEKDLLESNKFDELLNHHE